MTRKLSVRASARAHYLAAAAQPAAPAPKRSLTDEARDLYENSIVPVREIARLAGVTERTLYKYVERGNWKRRNIALSQAMRRAKGAGGRFIRREQIGEPHPTGLKALDPEGARRNALAMRRARRVARKEERRAESELNTMRSMRLHGVLMTAFIDLAGQASCDPRHLRAADAAGWLILQQMQTPLDEPGQAVSRTGAV